MQNVARISLFSESQNFYYKYIYAQDAKFCKTLGFSIVKKAITNFMLPVVNLCENKTAYTRLYITIGMVYAYRQ